MLFSGLLSAQTIVKLPNLLNQYDVSLHKNIDDGIDVVMKNSKNTNIAGTFTVPKGTTEADFIAKVYAKITEITPNYYFKDPKTDVGIPIALATASTVTHDQMATAITTLDQKEFIKMVKSQMKYKATAGETFDKFLKSMKVGDTKPVFIIPGFEFKQVNATKIDLLDVAVPTAIVNIDKAKEDDFYANFYTTYHLDTNVIKKYLLTAAEYAVIKPIDFKNEDNNKRLSEIYNQAIGKNEFTLINNYMLTDNVAIPSVSKIFGVSIKNNFAANYFTLKFCDMESKCTEVMQMPYDIDKGQFKSNIESFIIDPLKESPKKMRAEDIENLFGKIKSFNEKKLIQENTQDFQKTISGLAEAIDNMETQYSGILKPHREINVYTKDTTGIWTYRKVEDEKLILIDTTIYVRFFNNKVKDILIKGKLKKFNPTQKFDIMNVSYSFPLRSFNNSKHYLPISPNDNDANGYFININDLFDYDNHKSWNYSVRNKEYNIDLEKPVKLEERKIMDFVTAVIFSDVLGLNNKNANALLQAEMRFKVPLWIYNFGMTTLLHSLNADVNATLYNGFDDNSRYITVADTDVIKDEAEPAVIKGFKINNFDYIKFNNINAGASIGLVNIEFKGLSTELSFGYGIRYYRAGLRYKIVNEGTEDIIKDYQLHALTHELIANFEIRPQLNFGADLNIAYNFINARGATDDILIQFKENDNLNDRTVVRVQLNLYSKLNPDKSNDGLYARLGGFYHTGAKDFYPQLLVGYATNLSSFVNKFKK